MAEIIPFATAWRKLRDATWPLPDSGPDEIEILVGRRVHRWRWEPATPVAPEGASHWRRLSA